MKDRIALVIQASGINRSTFAKRLNVSQAFVSQICSGAAKPSARTISDICSKFNVSRQWLETGEGPMMLPDADPDMEVISDLMNDVDDPVAGAIKSIYRIYKELSPADQEVLRRFIRSLRDQK